MKNIRPLDPFFQVHPNAISYVSMLSNLTHHQIYFLLTLLLPSVIKQSVNYINNHLVLAEIASNFVIYLFSRLSRHLFKLWRISAKEMVCKAIKRRHVLEVTFLER